MIENLFANIPTEIPEELVDVLASNEHVRIERIVSKGQSSPDRFWYDQPESEWVIVLKGEAGLRMEGDSQALHLRPGDHVLIAPHQKHRVDWTAAGEVTIWLAVFFAESPA